MPSTSLIVWVVLNILGVASAAPFQPQPKGREPCADVSELYEQQVESLPHGQFPLVPAYTAWQCLYSIPFNASYALEWLESFRPYLQWQTTTAYLKDPPTDYWREPYDLVRTTQNRDLVRKANQDTDRQPRHPH
jgi:hypothetical protein